MAFFRHGRADGSRGATPARGATALALAGLLALGACGGSDEPVALAPVEGFAGLVAADEPNAAVVGREVLGNGGTAADAAVAMYFALTVTYPSRAGLAGGGSCLVYDRDLQGAEALSFVPQSGIGGGTLPLGPRAMAALHARYGSVRWELLLAPAEALARFGHDMSRALAQDFALGGQGLLQNPEAGRIFAPNGRLAPGQPLVQPELAGVLAGLRQQGAGYLHGGAFLGRYADATAAAGLPVDADSLRNAVPAWIAPVQYDVDSLNVYFTPPPAANGLLAADLYAMAEAAGFGSAEGAEALHLFLEASAQAFANRAGWLGSGGQTTVAPQQVLADPVSLDRARHRPAASLQPAPAQVVEPSGGTGFVVADRFGNAVACSLTMNGLFGAQRMAPGTGIVLAAPPPGGYAISPVAAIVGSRSGRLYMGVAGGDGAAAATAVARVLLSVLEQDGGLVEAVGAGRVHHNGLPDAAFVEERVPAEQQQALRGLGHEVLTLPALGLVSAFWCEGSLTAEGACEVVTDPRGFGLSQIAQ